MQKLLLAFIICWCFSVNAQTSVYHPFPDSSAVWNFSCSQFCMSGSTIENYSMIIDGDTEKAKKAEKVVDEEMEE